MLSLSHSELSTFKQCKRRWYLSYVLGWALDPSRASPISPAHLGSAVHLALQAHYGYGIDPFDCLRWDYSQVSQEHPEFTDDLERELETAIAMLEGYLVWVADEGIDAGIEILGTEVEQATRIKTAAGHEIELRGKFDQLVRREIDGSLMVRDFKTVSVLQQIDQLRLSRQLRHYCLIQSLNAKGGQRVDGGVFLMLRRVRRGAASKAPYFAQEVVHISRNELNSYWLEVREVADQIINVRQRIKAGEDNRSVVYASPSDACNWICQFRHICPMMDDSARWSDALQSNFVKQDPYSYYNNEKITSLIAHFSADKS